MHVGLSQKNSFMTPHNKSIIFLKYIYCNTQYGLDTVWGQTGTVQILLGLMGHIIKLHKTSVFIFSLFIDTLHCGLIPHKLMPQKI